MKDTELKREKARALYAVYKQGLEAGQFTSMRDAASRIARHPAPRFYIEADTVSLLIGRILSNKSLIDLSYSQQRMVWQLYQDYKQYLADHPGTELTRTRIMEELVERPAPEFYMTPDAVRKALRGIIDEVKQKAGW